MAKLFGYLEGFITRFWFSMDNLMGAVGAPEVQGWFSNVWNAVLWIITGKAAE